MKSIIETIVVFFIGMGIAFLIVFLTKDGIPEPKTEYISTSTYQKMFPKRELKNIPDYRFYVIETEGEVKTEIKKVEVPVLMDGFRLYDGDFSISNNRINIGLWNPHKRQYEIDSFILPKNNWSLDFETALFFNHHKIHNFESSLLLRYKRFKFGPKVEYIVDRNQFLFGGKFAFMIF